jgi:hypothetical protein
VVIVIYKDRRTIIDHQNQSQESILAPGIRGFVRIGFTKYRRIAERTGFAVRFAEFGLSEHRFDSDSAKASAARHPTPHTSELLVALAAISEASKKTTCQFNLRKFALPSADDSELDMCA